MTTDELATLVDQYRSGLEAQLHLLRELQGTAARQRHVTIERNFEAFAAIGDERDTITQQLVALDEELRLVRRQLVEHRRAAQHLPGFAEAVALHRQASELVSHILTSDRESFRALSDAEVARRAALSGLEQGEMTLAAYRKVLAPPTGGAALVDERG